MPKLISMLLFLRIAIINISGNTGKTTVAMHGVDNALPDAEIICVESLNEIPKIDGQNLTTLKAEEADKLFEKMLISRNRENLIADIGSSVVEQLLARMVEYDEVHEEFDLILIPVTPENKQQIDTIKTVELLINYGINPDKIRIVFNRAPKSQDYRDVFLPVIKYLEEKGYERMDVGAVIWETDFFDKLNRKGLSLNALLAEDYDAYDAILDSPDPEISDEDRLSAAKRMKDIQRARRLKTHIDEVFGRILEGVYAYHL
jgi:hypothetical protein